MSDRSVLLIGNFLSNTGKTATQVEGLAVHLRCRGWNVLTASSWRNRFLRMADMALTPLLRRGAYGAAYVDLFSGPAASWAMAASSSLRRANRPFVLMLRGGNLPCWARTHSQEIRRLLGMATAVVAPSCYLQKEMREYRSDIRVVANAMDLDRYVVRDRQAAAPRLIWLRSFNDTYNPSLAAKAVALLVPHWPETHLIMVGPDMGDGAMQRFKQTVAELGLAKHISIVGGVSKTAVPEWLNKGDVFLNTSKTDNMPVSVMEAMACGLCVISTNVGGVPQIVADGQNGLLVPSDDPEAMAAAVERLLTDPALSSRLSKNARRQAEQFDWSIIVSQWEDVFTALLARN